MQLPEGCAVSSSGAVECAAVGAPAWPDLAQWWPSALLLATAAIFGGNFALGSVMNDVLPLASETREAESRQ